jgi:peroxiredoxin
MFNNSNTHIFEVKLMPETIQILQPGQMMPDFSLPSTMGKPFRISFFRNRANLVLVFCGTSYEDEIGRLLSSLNEAAPEISRENSYIAAILPVSLDRAGEIVDKYSLNFPILADEDGNILYECIHVNHPGFELYIIDRYGEIASVERVETAGHFPKAEEILDWVRFLEIQCPE